MTEKKLIKTKIIGERKFEFFSDDSMRVTPLNSPDFNSSLFMCGDYVKIEGEITEENIAKAKEDVLEKVFLLIKKEAMEKELFIIREFDGITTVGFKCDIPKPTGEPVQDPFADPSVRSRLKKVKLSKIF